MVIASSHESTMQIQITVGMHGHALCTKDIQWDVRLWERVAGGHIEQER